MNILSEKHELDNSTTFVVYTDLNYFEELQNGSTTEQAIKLKLAENLAKELLNSNYIQFTKLCKKEDFTTRYFARVKIVSLNKK